MKIWSLIAILSFISASLYAQEYRPPKLTNRDSVALSSVWTEFKGALAVKNIQVLHELSLPIVDCDLFQPATIPEQNPNISIDTFLHQFYRLFPDLKLWQVVKKKKYHMTVEPAMYSDQTNVKFKKDKSLMLYYIWYVVLEPNELMKGHEGQSEAFQFMKVKGKFKFFGMTSIP